MKYEIEHEDFDDFYQVTMRVTGRFGYLGIAADRQKFATYKEAIDYLKNTLLPGDKVTGLNLSESQMAGLENLLK